MRKRCKSAKQQVSGLIANVSPILSLWYKWPKFATTWQTKRGAAIWLTKTRKQTLPEKSKNSKFHIPSHYVHDINWEVKIVSTLKCENLIRVLLPLCLLLHPQPGTEECRKAWVPASQTHSAFSPLSAYWNHYNSSPMCVTAFTGHGEFCSTTGRLGYYGLKPSVLPMRLHPENISTISIWVVCIFSWKKKTST